MAGQTKQRVNDQDNPTIEEAPPPIDCFYYLISRTALVATSLLKQGFAESGVAEVKPAYLGALMCLWQRDGMKLSKLGRCAGLEPSSITGLVDRMERDGLVERVADPDDRRVMRVRLTKRGREVQPAVETVVATALATLGEGIDGEALYAGKEVLKQILLNSQKRAQTQA